MLRVWLSSAILLLVVQSPVYSGQTESSSRRKPPTLTQIWALDATYTDPNHGVTFRYPSVWRAATQFGYHPPALKDSFAPPIAGFAYDLDGFPHDPQIGPYASTNLEGVGVLYSAIDSASAAECKKKAASLSDVSGQHRVVIDGRPFSVYETGEEGMSQSISGSLYSTYANHSCYLFETDVTLASEGSLDDVQGLTTPQLSFIFAHLQNIMKSVRIVPSK
jgi:hypothetical protein